MTEARIILVAMFAALFAFVLSVGVAECAREMHARVAKRRRAVLYDRHGTTRPLYVEDLRQKGDF
jgi:hypothetical protein